MNYISFQFRDERMLEILLCTDKIHFYFKLNAWFWLINAKRSRNDTQHVYIGRVSLFVFLDHT